MRPKDPKKDILLRIKAMELIVRDGFDGFSMHKLAKVSKIATATIYIYFKDREDLIHQLCADAANSLSEATLADFNPDVSFKTGLKKQWQNRITFYLENPQTVQFLEMVKHSPYYEKVSELKSKLISETMHRFVKNAIENKQLVPLPLEVYWSVAFSPMYQLVKFHLDGHSLGKRPFKLSEETLDQCLQLVIKALKPPK
ncbi:MAG: TetR/AcrR family transcriptional regulator [Bacteroidetes bacterium]|nr:TetR/AcrR family transcriptional regulator [Bacteroidota bacterium]